MRSLKRTRIVIAVIAFVLGVGLIAYPYVSDYVHKQQQHDVVSSQVEAVSSTAAEELSAEMAAAQDYNARLLSSKTVVTDPFDTSAQSVTDGEYESLLNLSDDGVMGTLVIPKIELQMPIYHYTNDEELQRGVGHMESTSLPVGGESTHAVLAGHNGLPSVKIFDRLDELVEGDYFVIEVLGEEHAYRVTSKETVLPDETESLVVQTGRDLVTLVTCTPYGINTHRLLVHAERCEMPAEWNEGDRETTDYASTSPEVPLLQFSLLGLAIALGMIASWAISRRVRHRLERRGLEPRHSRHLGARRGKPTGRHFSVDERAPDGIAHGEVGLRTPSGAHRGDGAELPMTGAQGMLPARPRRRPRKRGRHA